MPDFHFQYSSGPEAKTLPPGTGIVISAGLAALIIGTLIWLWLGGDVANSKDWVAALLAVVVFTICVVALGAYRDRLQAEKHREYLEKVSAIDRKTMRKD